MFNKRRLRCQEMNRANLRCKSSGTSESGVNKYSSRDPGLGLVCGSDCNSMHWPKVSLSHNEGTFSAKSRGGAVFPETGLVIPNWNKMVGQHIGLYVEVLMIQLF